MTVEMPLAIGTAEFVMLFTLDINALVRYYAAEIAAV